MQVKKRRNNLREQYDNVLLCSAFIHLFSFQMFTKISYSLSLNYNTGYRMPAPECATPEIYRLMLECWHMDPIRRPTFEVIQRKLEDIFALDSNEYKEAQAF